MGRRGGPRRHRSDLFHPCPGGHASSGADAFSMSTLIAAGKPRLLNLQMPTPREGKSAAPAPGPAKVDIREMSFTYPGRRALEKISISIFERRVTAIIGPSGCGKSTLI